MSVLSVSASLKFVAISSEITTLIHANKDAWVSFGKKNSHILRTILFKMFGDAGLGKEAIFMVYFFHSLIKDKDRILAAIEIMGDDVKANPAVQEAAKFMRTRMVKYVKDESSSKFASVHLPATNPGLDILAYLMSLGTMSAGEAKEVCDEVYKDILGRNTMTQIALDSELQSANKELVKDFWNNTVVLRDAEDRKKNKLPVGFQEAFYDTASRDQYKLVSRAFKEVAAPASGYSEANIKKYIVLTLSAVVPDKKDDSSDDKKDEKAKDDDDDITV